MFTSVRNIILSYRLVFLYGLFAAILVFSLKWLQWKFLILTNSLEVYFGLIAAFFTVLGVWIATRFIKPKIQEVVVEKEIYVPQLEENSLNETELEKFNLTEREYEVLQLLATGCNNAEIADQLFLSISTVKTHVSNLLVKMGVNNRTHAVTKAQKLRII